MKKEHEPMGVRLPQQDDYKSAVNEYKSEIGKRFGFLRILGKGEELPIQRGYIQLSVSASNQQTEEYIVASEILKSDTTRLVIVGLPGTGKSTMLQYFAFECADKASQFFPIHFRISYFTQTDDTLFDFLGKVAAGIIGKKSGMSILQNDKFCRCDTLILMDGLDEISKNNYREFCKRLNNFLVQYPDCRIVITSRIVNFQPNDFGTFKVYRITDLQPSDIEKYIKINCSEEIQERVWETIQNDERLMELAKTPFLLAMMCTNPQELGSKATQRASLYASCTRYLLKAEDWQTSRPKETPESVKELEDALKTIAVRFFKLDIMDSFPIDEVLFYISRSVIGTTPAREILDRIVTNSGLLQLAGNECHFVHRSIWEYFVAQGMRNEDLDSLLAKANVPNWEDPIRLYVGLTPESDLDKVIKGLWERNKALVLRSLNECKKFPDELLCSLYLRLSRAERMGLVSHLRESLQLCRNDLESKRMVLDTLSSVARVEKDCEVIYECIVLLEEKNEPEYEKLVSRILDLENAEKRRREYMYSPTFKFEFVQLKGSKFEMGSDSTPDPREHPVHIVRLSPFQISKYLVTNALYYDKFPFAVNRKDDYSSETGQPVNNVNWFEAYIFARWLNCDLPTEAEWEYACRAGGDDDHLLNDPEKIGQFGWYGVNSGNRSHTVGTKRPNSFGLYDMQGNLREWCKDWYADDYYRKCKEASETEDPKGSITGQAKVLRGGCFDWAVTNLRPTYRNFNPPDNIYFVNGFRLVYKGKTTENQRREQE